MAPVKSNVPTHYIKYKGLFNFSDVMQSIRKWFEENNYRFEEPKHQWKVPSEGVEAEIKMKGEHKINEYVRYDIDVFVRTFDMKEVEMVKEGQKIKTNDGRIAIEVSGAAVFDWQNRFHGNKFLQNLQDFFHKFIIKQDIGDWWEDDIFIKVIELKQLIRSKLGHEAI